MNIQELYYDADDIAYYIVLHDMGTRERSQFIEWLYDKEYEFLKPQYKESKRKFTLDIDYFVNYIVDSDGIGAEIDQVENDFAAIGMALNKDGMIPDYWKFHSLPFKFLRLDIAHSDEKSIRTTLRDLLKGHDQDKSDSFQLMHIVNCLLFYHIQPYMEDHSECNFSKILPDDVIMFTVM